jgi:DNA-binding PadR family transcriptional regulator
MKDNNQLFKGTLTTVVLKLLSDNQRMYGYEITKKVKELTAGNIQLTEGALYPALHKLEAEGLIQSTIEQTGNRPRKYYHLTRTGKKEIKYKLADFSSFITDLQHLLNLKPTN